MRVWGYHPNSLGKGVPTQPGAGIALAGLPHLPVPWAAPCVLTRYGSHIPQIPGLLSLCLVFSAESPRLRAAVLAANTAYRDLSFPAPGSGCLRPAESPADAAARLVAAAMRDAAVDEVSAPCGQGEAALLHPPQFVSF